MYYIKLLYFIIFLHICIFIILGTPRVLLNINSGITLTLWILFIYLSKRYKNNLFLLGPILIFIINELLYVNFNIDGLVGEARTQLYYDITTTYFIKNNKQNTNLTEGVYLNDLYDNNSRMTISEAKQLNPAQANQNKFDKFFLFLNIDPSEYKNIRILDMGCGNGDFIKYCNSLGIKTTGMSISNEQVDLMKQEKLDVYVGSYRDLQKQFIGKYDIVTFWGSLEHLTQSYPCSKSGEQKAEQVLKTIMSHVKQYYRPNSNYKLLFNTTLHMNKKICEGTLDVYILERAYGGWYFYDAPNQTLSDKIETIGFKKVDQEDFTYHYYMASKIDPTHFGNPSHPNMYNISAILFGSLINPSFIFMGLYSLRGQWMWQFDNKHHTYDQSCNTCTFVERSNRPVTLLWSVNKLNRI